ncbi:uncharacterized protein LOC144179448 [Haemaphysalis longicornis]
MNTPVQRRQGGMLRTVPRCCVRTSRRRVLASGGFFCCGFLWITTLIQGMSCLRLLEMSAPSAAILGRGMWLNCSFDLESDELYSVKWYKNDTEFYRYIPRDNPPAQNYDLPGVVVDMSRSGEGHVFVAHVNLSSEGNYRCEASAEAPQFQTVSAEKEVKVFETSPDSPTIEGGLPKYRINDLVNLTCRSAEYNQPPELKWFINDKEARTDYLVPHPRQRYPKFSTSLGLRFRVRPEHFEDERMHLRCTVTLSHVLNTSSAEANIRNRQRTTSGLRAASDDASNEGMSLWAPFLSSLLICFALLEL